MQITINTADILGDETTIRDEVIDQVSKALISEMRHRADKLITETFEKALVGTIREKVKEIVEVHLDAPFIPKDEYGRHQEETTVRNQLAKVLRQECTFKSQNYRSDMNAFSKAVMETVEKEVSQFKKEFNSMVSTTLIQQCMTEAAAKLKAACGIK